MTCVLCGSAIHTFEGQRTCSLQVAIAMFGADNGVRAAGSPAHDECHALVARSLQEAELTRLAG